MPNEKFNLLIDFSCKMFHEASLFARLSTVAANMWCLMVYTVQGGTRADYYLSICARLNSVAAITTAPPDDAGLFICSPEASYFKIK